MDTDGFDLFCEHLLVEEKLTRRIVGTYRMQTGSAAARNVGYYSAQEFNLDPYEPLRAGILELGRASIDCEHRTPEVLIGVVIIGGIGLLFLPNKIKFK